MKKRILWKLTIQIQNNIRWSNYLSRFLSTTECVAPIVVETELRACEQSSRFRVTVRTQKPVSIIDRKWVAEPTPPPPLYIVTLVNCLIYGFIETYSFHRVPPYICNNAVNKTDGKRKTLPFGTQRYNKICIK